jgi:hypothetical protein
MYRCGQVDQMPALSGLLERVEVVDLPVGSDVGRRELP